MRRVSAFALFFVLFVTALAQGQRLVIVSWDGSPDWVVDRLIAEGKMPTLKRMKEQGVYADSVIAACPSVTAAGHASIWTGTWPSKHGVTGNEVPLLPRSEHAITESMSGFSSKALQAQPIWMSAALAGKRVAVLSATQSFPPEPWVEKIKATESGIYLRNIALFSGFESKLYGPAVYTESTPLKDTERFGRKGKEFEFNVGDQKFAAFFGKNEAGTYVDCTIYRLVADRASFATYMRMGSTEFSQPVEVKKGDDWGLVTFVLFDLAPDASHFMLYQGTASAIKGQFDDIFGDGYIRAYGGFHDLPIFGFYDKGNLGPTYWMGGDGKAEERLLKLIEKDFDKLSEGFRYAIRQFDPNLIMHYTPAPDSMGHMLMGALDPQSPKYDKALAEKLWPVYEKTLELADKWLGEVIAAAGPKSIVAVVSDHGMEGVGKQVSINRILADAGIVSLTDGKTDYSKSKAFCPNWNNFFVTIHTTDWKGGIVATSEKDAVAKQVKDALLSYKDPQSGKPVITSVIPASDIEGAGGPAGGDLYLELAPGYYPTEKLLQTAVVDFGGKIGGGSHGFLPTRQKMRAIFYAIGPGLAQGRNLGEIRQIDIVPSLAILASIPTPSESDGKNLRLTQRN